MAHTANLRLHHLDQDRGDYRGCQPTLSDTRTDGAAMRIHALVCVKALCKCFTKVSCYPHPNPAQRKGQSSGKWWLYCSGLLTHTEINGRHLEGDGSFSTSWQVLSSCRLSWGLSCFILLERWCLDWAWWIQLSLLDITVRLYPR